MEKHLLKKQLSFPALKDKFVVFNVVFKRNILAFTGHTKTTSKYECR